MDRMCVSDSVCVWLFVYVCVWQCVCLCDSVCLCETVCDSVFVYVWLCLCGSVWLCLCDCVCVTVCVCDCLCMCVCECVYVTVCVLVWQCVCACVTVCVCVCVWQSLCVTVCVAVSVCDCVCGSVCVCPVTQTNKFPVFASQHLHDPACPDSQSCIISPVNSRFSHQIRPESFYLVIKSVQSHFVCHVIFCWLNESYTPSTSLFCRLWIKMHPCELAFIDSCTLSNLLLFSIDISNYHKGAVHNSMLYITIQSYVCSWHQYFGLFH